jgi:hypothetical protein
MAAQSMGVCSPEKMKSVPPIAVIQLTKRLPALRRQNNALSREEKCDHTMGSLSKALVNADNLQR